MAGSMATRKRRTVRSTFGAGPERLGVVIVRAAPDQPPHRGPSPMPLWLWQEAVGPRIARRARPVRLERGVLTVRAATSVWAQELTFLAPNIISQLSALGLVVKSVRFAVGPVETLPAEDKPKLPPVKGEPERPLNRELNGAIQKIEDNSLRNVISRAARANLAWQSGIGKTAPKTRVEATTSTTPDARAPRSAEPKTSAPAQTSPTTRAKYRDRP
jgi:hypothetical protein